MNILKIKLTLLVAIILFGLTTTESKAQIKVISNKVGIGTTNPSHKLHVNGTVKIERGYTDFIIDNREEYLQKQ